MLSGTAGEDRVPQRPKAAVRRVWEVATVALLLLTVLGSVAAYFLARARRKQATRDLQVFLAENYVPPIDTARLRRLMERGAPLAFRDKYGQTAFTAAVVGRDAPLVREMLGRGVDVNQRDKYGETPLTHAAYYPGEEQMITVLLAGGATVDARDNTGMTPLYIAAKLGHTGSVRLLAAAKADPNVTLSMGHGGTSALTIAAERGNAASIAVLLEYGAEVDRKDHRGVTALQCAVRKKHPQVVRLLGASGAHH